MATATATVVATVSLSKTNWPIHALILQIYLNALGARWGIRVNVIMLAVSLTVNLSFKS